MDIRELEIFSIVCELRSLSRAAFRLGVSQPALSRTIRKLEAEAGLALFRRTGRGVEPTEAGHVVDEHARRVLEQADELKARLGQLRGHDIGEATVLLPHYVSRILVPPLVKQFALSFPQASIHVFENASADIPGRLIEGSADLGVFYQPQGTISLPAEHLASERMYLVGLPTMVGAKPDPIGFAEVTRMPLILPSRYAPFRTYVEQFATASGRSLRVVRELETSYTQLAFVLEGEGATILPLSHFYEEAGEGLVVARPIEDPVMLRQIRFAFGSRASGRLASSAFSLLKQVIGSRGDVIGWHLPGELPAL